MVTRALPVPGAARPRRFASRLRGLAATAGSAARTVTAMAVKPHKAALANLLHMPLTVAGVASIDFAAFHIAHGWGFLITGLSLIVLENLIADE